MSLVLIIETSRGEGGNNPRFVSKGKVGDGIFRLEMKDPPQLGCRYTRASV